MRMSLSMLLRRSSACVHPVYRSIEDRDAVRRSFKRLSLRELAWCFACALRAVLASRPQHFTLLHLLTLALHFAWQRIAYSFIIAFMTSAGSDAASAFLTGVLLANPACKPCLHPARTLLANSACGSMCRSLEGRYAGRTISLTERRSLNYNLPEINRRHRQNAATVRYSRHVAIFDAAGTWCS